MVETEKRISTAQLFTVIFILGMGLKILMLPVLMLKVLGRDSVLGLAAMGVVELLCLGAMLAAIMLSPEKSFYDLVSELAGKIAAKIIFTVFAAFFFFKLVLLAGEVRVFFSENLLQNFSSTVYSIPLCGLCVVIGMGTLRAIGRASQFLFPFIAAATLCLFVLIGMGVDFSEMFPFGEYGIKSIASDSFKHAMWFGDYSSLVVVLGAVKRTKRTVAAGVVAGVLASLAVMFYLLGLTASFSNVCYLIRFGQNVTGMSHYALGDVMQGRLDVMLFCLWTVSVLVEAGFYAFATVSCLNNVLPVKKEILSLAVGVALFVLLLLWQSTSDLQAFAVKYFAVPAFIFQIAVPVFALIITAAARRRKKKNLDASSALQNAAASKSEAAFCDAKEKGAECEAE